MVNYIINNKFKKVKKGEMGEQAAQKTFDELEKRVKANIKRNIK